MSRMSEIPKGGALNRLFMVTMTERPLLNLGYFVSWWILLPLWWTFERLPWDGHFLRELQRVFFFLSTQADETAEISTQPQFVLLLHSLMSNTACRKVFCGHSSAVNYVTALCCSAAILPEDWKTKLICQAYDRVSEMRGRGTAGVHWMCAKCTLYPLLCTSTILIKQQATSNISQR